MGRRRPSKINALRSHVGYIRVSTADQAQGISLAAQEEKSRAFAFGTGRTSGARLCRRSGQRQEHDPTRVSLARRRGTLR